jgi:hypothetical protein
MKRRKKPMPIPQWEFEFAPGTFNLMGESGIDGERVIRERTALEEARKRLSVAQAKLPLEAENKEQPIR